MSDNRKQLLLELGCILRDARRAKGYKVGELAEEIGVTKRYISALESGQRAPGYENLREIIRCLGISADTIFYPESAEDSDARQVMRQYECCTEHEKQIIKAALNAARRNK